MMKAKNGSKPEKLLHGKRLLYASITIITIAMILVSVIFYTNLNRSEQPKAAIIDELSSSQLSPGSRYPNQTFVETVKELLYERFSVVDYYSDNATVEEYKHLASHDYKLIVWRAHSALDLDSNYVAISTCEKYDPNNYGQYLDYGKYLDNEQLTLCNITGDPNLYFAITPKFITEVMSGRFKDTVIILMSCNGLKQGYYKTAQAFEEKGARVLISWDAWVSSPNNDNAITLLLSHLINENDTIDEAVGKIPEYASEFGPSRLRYDPHNDEVSSYQIPDYKQNVGSVAAIVILKKVKSIAV
jgi:hypothetical protein